ncbi:carbon monoxide dehydrogenase [Acidianus sulfidivorans JP7]|uniref:Carbon monoxide dehydrogenase n=1 Tax=Acidianus sulfidivorans JP7 TaxID=619593 RepID=A0A2U9IKR3_9CREN|nr:SRPBCC domain-containing protein [Acidianus sulfidivorans]AWR96619.1 carbon monoxide dehydrogenase [Acidianus sulfidivorans JP7]
MNKISGKEKISSNNDALQFFKDYRNLLNCTPGIKDINGDSFTAEIKIGPIRVEVQGKVKEHKIDGKNITDVIEVSGPGITVSITTHVNIEDSNLIWDAEYEISGSLANALQKTISKQAEEITRKIISCTISRLNTTNNT